MNSIQNLFSLEGKTAIVTGANTGLGQGISVALAAAGAHVFGMARRSCAETAEKVKEMGGIKIIVLSAMCSDEIVKKAIELGADYYMAKPFDPKLLLERLSFIDNVSNEKKSAYPNDGSGNFYKISLDEKISKIFINVGIPPHIKGYVFLREGVKMAVDDPSVINNITKKLYPMIGEKFNTTPSKVERDIRHAIEVAWNRGRIDTINSILGVRAYIGAEKPTNGEFIALVADKMLLEKM